MIGARLYLLRKQHGLSQKELGEKIAVSHYTISSYEKGRSEPNDDITVKLAQVFNVTADYLLGLVDEPLPLDRSAGTVFVPERLAPEQRELLARFLGGWGATFTKQ